MNRSCFLIVALGVLLGGCTTIQAEPTYQHGTVTLPSGTTIPVEISDTPAKRTLGLGKRGGLRAGWGMLFVFEKTGSHPFWMKDMHFAIDILWLRNRRIVHIAHNVVPPVSGKKPETLVPPVSANLVLELAAGQAEALGLETGQSLRYQF